MSTSSTTRSWEIDALRGLMLLLMLVTHLPTRFSSFLGQPFGYVSAAEGFVLISAYLAGLVYSRMGSLKGDSDMSSAMLRRAFKIYLCQVGLLLFLFTVIAGLGLYANQPAVLNLMSFYLQMPTTAITHSLLLVYQPPLLDILPLYVAFMLLSPAIIALAKRIGWELFLSISIALWFLTQFDFSYWVYEGAAGLFGINVPYQETGAFSIWAWQLIWVIGLWMGFAKQHSLNVFRFPKWAVYLALIIAGFSFFWRHYVGMQVPSIIPELNALFDKWTLAPLRLINLFALMIVVMRFSQFITEALPRQRFLETLGSASLAVFSAHLLLVLIVLSTLGANYERSFLIDIPLLLGSVLMLYGVAIWRNHTKAQRKAEKSHAPLMQSFASPALTTD